MNEPADLLIRAAVERVQPMVRELREAGWAVTVVVHAEPLSVALRISLDGLKRPVDVTGRTYEAARTPPERPTCPTCGSHTPGLLFWPDPDAVDPCPDRFHSPGTALEEFEPQTIDELLTKLDRAGNAGPWSDAALARAFAEDLRRVIDAGADR